MLRLRPGPLHAGGGRPINEADRLGRCAGRRSSLFMRKAEKEFAVMVVTCSHQIETLYEHV